MCSDTDGTTEDRRAVPRSKDEEMEASARCAATNVVALRRALRGCAVEGATTAALARNSDRCAE